MSSESIRTNQIRQDALNGRLSFDQARNRIIGRQGDGLARLLLLADGLDFFLKISDTGIDVLNATDDQLTFNSKNNLFKIAESDTIDYDIPSLSMSGANAFASKMVPHTQGDEPLVIAFITIPGNPSYTRFFGGSDVTGTFNGTSIVTTSIFREQIAATSTHITFTTEIAWSAGFAQPAITAKIAYFVLTQTVPS